MLKREIIGIALIYVPVKRRATLEQAKVDTLAASVLADGMRMPILGAAGWRPFRAGRKAASPESRKVAGRDDDPGLSRRRTQTFIGTIASGKAPGSSQGSSFQL